MKKNSFKPGFEFIFSLSILAVLGLSPLVFGQTTRDLQITITNGDTTINGKNIKDLSAADRKDALKNINQIAVIRSDDNNGPGMPPPSPMIVNDGKQRHMKKMRLYVTGDQKDSVVSLNYSMDGEPMHKMEIRDDHFNRDDKRPEMRHERRNTQNFSYNNVDNDGIVTRVSYHVSDHHAMLDYDAAKQPDSQLDMIDLTDLSLVPEFTQAKTELMFNLPSKTTAEVTFKDGKGNLLWSAKAMNGTFSKSFPMGLNGIYYLQVKQGSKIAVKEIEKE